MIVLLLFCVVDNAVAADDVGPKGIHYDGETIGQAREQSGAVRMHVKHIVSDWNEHINFSSFEKVFE